MSKAKLITTREATRQVPAHCKAPRAAILMVNLGTPDEPTAPALRRYLRQFLSDPRVIEVPKPIWWFILNGIILPFRAPKSARAYASIWTEHGSPLLINNRRLADELQRELHRTLPRVDVMLAMSYGQPSIDQAIDRLRAENIQRLLVLPLYPQYSATTTASVFDAVTRSLGRLRWLPEVRFINDYCNEPDWLDAIAASIRDHQSQHGQADQLLFSFHGIPKRNLQAGDPYYCQCQASARQIAERLQMPDSQWKLSFQSRLGKAEWLKPYTDETLRTMAKNGVKRVQVICPGFSIDCLETLEEIAEENREEFIEAGGQELEYIPCLNDSPAHVKLLANLCRKHGQGWPEFAGQRAAGEDALKARVERADQAAERLNLG
ncbi:ferrochelatase [Wenzhouxiangella marina]|nr:ferrochelatase [Wenzhouxiangella marina]MBB6088456.1 ferrochelatase [Wenzhouxiangella marina]